MTIGEQRTVLSIGVVDGGGVRGERGWSAVSHVCHHVGLSKNNVTSSYHQ